MTQKEPREADVLIGQRIRTIRVLRGLSQQGLADHCGITFQQIQKYEKGTNRVSGSRLLEIAKCLQVTPVDLLGEGNERAPLDTPMTAAEVRLLRYFRALPDNAKAPIVRLIEAVATPV